MKNNDFYIKGSGTITKNVPQMQNQISEYIFTCGDEVVAKISVHHIIKIGVKVIFPNRTCMLGMKYDALNSLLDAFYRNEIFGMTEAQRLYWQKEFSKLVSFHKDDSKTYTELGISKFIFHFIRFLGYRKEIICTVLSDNYKPSIIRYTNKNELIC